MANSIWDKYGGIKKKTKKVKQKAPMSIEQMMEKSLKKQKDMISDGNIGGSGCWWKDGVVSPKVGIYTLIDGELHMDKGQFSSFVNDVERSFRNGEFEGTFKKIETKQRKAIKKRASTMGKV